MLTVLIFCAVQLSVECLYHFVQVVSSHGLFHRHLSNEELSIADFANLAFLFLSSCIDSRPRKGSFFVETILAIRSPAEHAVLDFALICGDGYLLATVAYLILCLGLDWSCKEVDWVCILELVLFLSDGHQSAVLAERLQAAFDLRQGFIQGILIFYIVL